MMYYTESERVITRAHIEILLTYDSRDEFPRTFYAQ